MSGPPVVRGARPDERDLVSSILTDAFVDEAGLNYWLRQDAAKERARRRFFAAAVRDFVHPQRALWVCEANGAPSGAAIWLDPGQKAYAMSAWRQLMLTPLLLSIAGLSGAARGKDVGARLAALHPREPHAHLVFLGVAPDAQGKGVGSAILKRTLAPLDRDGTLAFLETTTERNVALYQRHGFEITGEFELPGLRMWAMTREPRR
jgi:ribosomal protein S18 acetylase RimI-like enzyme